MRFVPDTPLQDEADNALGFRDFVELVQRSIYHTETPFLYGILGDWGIGKTGVTHWKYLWAKEAKRSTCSLVFENMNLW